MQKENYLYFAEEASTATGKAGMWPTSSFLGIDSLTTGTTNIYFKDQTGSAEVLLSFKDYKAITNETT